MRIGFAFGASEIISYLNKVKPPYNVSSANQQQALKALQNSAQFEKNRQLILSEKKRMEKLILIDGMVLVFRAHYAFVKNPRLTNDGRNVSAEFGFLNMLFTDLYSPII